MLKMLNPSLSAIEKRYLALCDFWCRMNNIKVKSVECIPLEDGSCDSKLTDRCDITFKTIYIKEYEESVLGFVNMIFKFIFKDINKEINDEIVKIANENAQVILYSSENEPTVEGNEELGTDKVFEFLTWLKRCAHNEKVEN